MAPGANGQGGNKCYSPDFLGLICLKTMVFERFMGVGFCSFVALLYYSMKGSGVASRLMRQFPLLEVAPRRWCELGPYQPFSRTAPTPAMSIATLSCG